MIAAVMVVLLWAAAGYRVGLSNRRERTLWRSSFTTWVVLVALAATSSVFGDQWIDLRAQAWNVAVLLTHLVLIGAAAAGSVFIVTLRRERVHARSVRWRIWATAGLVAIELASWTAAPIHLRELATTAEVNASSWSGAVFALAFALPATFVGAEGAQFYLSRAASRVDLTRMISMVILGVSSAVGAVLFAVGTGGVLAHQLGGSDMNKLFDLVNAGLFLVAMGLALGTLTLFAVPPVVEMLRNYLRWRSVRPLWQDLVRLHPEVHLDLPADGTPANRLRVRLQRALIETHDALRITSVSLPPDATLDDLATALHAVGGTRIASEALVRTQNSTSDDTAQLITLARSYSKPARQ